MRNRVPPMLKSIVISAFGVIIMSVYLLTIDIAGHYSSGHNITCIFNKIQNENIEMLPVNFAVPSVPFQIMLASIKLLYEGVHTPVHLCSSTLQYERTANWVRISCRLLFSVYCLCSPGRISQQMEASILQCEISDH